MEEDTAKSDKVIVSHKHFREQYYQGKKILYLLYIPLVSLPGFQESCLQMF